MPTERNAVSVRMGIHRLLLIGHPNRLEIKQPLPAAEFIARKLTSFINIYLYVFYFHFERSALGDQWRIRNEVISGDLRSKRFYYWRRVKDFIWTKDTRGDLIFFAEGLPATVSHLVAI